MATTSNGDIVLLGGDILDVSAEKKIITKIRVYGAIGAYSARRLGNGGDQKDVSPTGVYGETDGDCITTMPVIVNGDWDKVYNSSTGAVLKCTVENR